MMEYQIVAATQTRYELRSSERTIVPAAWIAVIASNGGWNTRQIKKGAATIVYFDTNNPDRIRQAIRDTLNTRNFAVRHRRRWEPKKATPAA